MRSGYHDPSLNAHCGLNPSIDSKITASDALVVAVNGGNPAIFYYAKPKGRHTSAKRKESMVAIRATVSRPLAILSDCVARGQRILSLS